MLPEVELEAVVCDDVVNDVVNLILATLRKSLHSDGFVCVTPVEQCYRVRTGNPQF